MTRGRKRSDGTPGVRKDTSVSRQREWARRQVAAGKCMICGKLRDNYAHYCDECASKDNERQRKRNSAVRCYKKKSDQ